MPIIGRRGQPAANPLQRSFVERIKAGRVVPILSDEALFDLVLGGYLAFTQSYAGYVEYPMLDKENLVKIAKFYKLKQEMKDQVLKFDYLNYVKNHVPPPGLWVLRALSANGVWAQFFSSPICAQTP